ncbi:HAD family hydrolase [Atopobium fossor]|uniref:HAD family hydrolase n=1 Tax=Atopobium fossor TaxID=39487 RepID=UPI000407C6AF|nr:HAD-IIB family hydrolase [Atopobium fossor]
MSNSGTPHPTHTTPAFPTIPLSTQERARLAKIRYVMTDLDGTMLTGASAVQNSSKLPSTQLIKTLVDLRNAGIEVVPVSGRNRAMTFEDARILSFRAWIAEMGGLICTKSGSQPEWTYFTGDMPYKHTSLKTPHDLICETGIVDELIARYPGKLETYHDNYVGFEYREVSVALRGSVEASEVQAILDSCSLPLYLADNGLVKRINGSTTLKGITMEHPQGIHTYHIMPHGLTKGSGIAQFAKLMHIEKDQMLAAGDSPADCEMADFVGTFLFMKNGFEHDDAYAELAKHDNAFVSNLPSTDGWCEAMQTLLAARA